MLDLLLAATISLAPITHPATARVLVVEAQVSTDEELRDVTVFAELSPGPILAGQSDDTWTCRDNGTLKTVRCTAALLPANSTTPLTFYIDAQAGRFRVDARIGPNGLPATTTGWFPHDIHVTHAGDAGEGSLRRAIALANEECEGLNLPCRIVFDEPMTVRPLTPLPVVWNRDIAIDGAGRVTIDGSLVSGGSGLEMTGSGYLTLVRGLTIRAFPWDGIHIDRHATDPVVIEECTIEANGSRGVTTESSSSMTLRRNVIRANGRSGVFALGAYATIEDNTIEANGASGVFVTRYGSRVARNRIGGNAHFGVAASRSLANFELTENAISTNGIAAIDRGLDGSDGDRYDDYEVSAAYIPPPRVTEASYDAGTNTTTIRGTYFDERDHWGTWSVELFATAGRDADAFLGRTTAANGVFTLAVPRDLRGLFITATGARHLYLGLSGEYWWTSEVGEPAAVQ